MIKVTPELLARYTEGLCSPKEKRAVEKWLDSSEAETSFPPEDDLSVHQRAIWHHVEQRIGQRTKPERVAEYWKPWLMAACLSLALGVSFLFLGKKTENKTIAEVQVASAHYQTVRTAKGEKRSVKLADGTEIYLNADSEIRFPEPFSDTSRLVFLKGEAYFTVAKDKKRPFTVQTSQTKVKVLGTIFNLKAYHPHTATLVVQEGKVQFKSISGKEKPMIFTANQRGIFNSASGLKKDNVYAIRYLGWKDNHLVFDNESMHEVARTLERWYDVEINEIPETLSREHFTGDFHEKTLDYVLERMSYVMEFKYSINNKSVTIH